MLITLAPILLALSIAAAFYGIALYKTRYYLSDMMFVSVLVSIPFGLVMRYSQRAGELSVGDMLLISPLALLATGPVVAGAWWGLRFANRIEEERALARIGLILLGCCYICGCIMFVPAALWAIGAVSEVCFDILGNYNRTRDSASLGNSIAVLAVSVVLMAPNLIIESRYRAKRKPMKLGEQRQAGVAPRPKLKRAKQEKD